MNNEEPKRKSSYDFDDDFENTNFLKVDIADRNADHLNENNIVKKHSNIDMNNNPDDNDNVLISTQNYQSFTTDYRDNLIYRVLNISSLFAVIGLIIYSFICLFLNPEIIVFKDFIQINKNIVHFQINITAFYIEC